MNSALLALLGARVGAGGVATFTRTGFYSSNTGSVVVDLGAEGAEREIIVAIAWYSSSSKGPHAVTLGGVPMAQEAGPVVGDSRAGAIYRLAVPTGTTATLAGMVSGSGYAVGVWASDRALTVVDSELVPYADTDTVTATLTSAADGLLVAAAGSRTGTANAALDLADVSAPALAHPSVGASPTTGSSASVTVSNVNVAVGGMAAITYAAA